MENEQEGEEVSARKLRQIVTGRENLEEERERKKREEEVVLMCTTSS